MAQFKVGQRVRKIGNNLECTAVVPLGTEGVIKEVNVTTFDGCRYDYIVDYGSQYFFKNAEGPFAMHWQLEPIQNNDSAAKYDGNTVVSWDDVTRELREIKEQVDRELALSH